MNIDVLRRLGLAPPEPVRRTPDHVDECLRCRAAIVVYTERRFVLCAACCARTFAAVER